MTLALALALLLTATSTATATATATTGSSDVQETETSSTGVSMGLEDLGDLEVLDRNDARAIDDASIKESIVDEIEVSAQRIAESSKPDTQLRITGKQLVERGVTNLAQALDLISDTPIRAAGRGGFQSDIRGARKGGVLMLLDGIPIADPYLGNFDVTSIPATDIAEIRVSLTPASPLDGPSGNGGVIEILTRAASGPTALRAGLQASDAPGAVASVTGRAPIAEGLAIRVSGQATRDNRDYAFAIGDNPPTGREDAKGGNAGLRVEKTFENTRLTLDAGVQRRSFVIPPTAEIDTTAIGSSATDIQFVRREDLFRGVAGAQVNVGHVILGAHAYTLAIDRDIDHYRDPLRTILGQSDHVFAHRTGGNAQADWLAASDLRLTAVTHLVVEGGRPTTTQVGAGQPLVTSFGGVAPIVEPAAGVSYAPSAWLAVDAAGGAAIPISVNGASPWPEAKTTVTLTATRALQLRITGARKGRLPSIKDRFDNLVGNPAVQAELSWAAEAGAIYKPWRWLSLDVTGFYRLIQGLIKNDPHFFPPHTGNVGDVRIYGGEARIEAAPIRMFSMSASYQYAHQSAADPLDLLDFFPMHRGEIGAAFRPDPGYGVWTRARYIGDRTDKMNTLSGYVTVDAAAWLKLEALRITLRGENLLGQSYEIHHGVPGFGRTLFLGLEGVLE